MKKIILIIFLLLILAVGYYAVFFEPYNFQIAKHTFYFENLTREKIKIVHLSDFHSVTFSKREKKVLEIVDKLSPDFVFITGDFIGKLRKAKENEDSLATFWQTLSDKYKNRVFAVLGNHDNLWVKNLLEKSGIKILNNESYLLNGFYLIGVDDPYTGRDDLLKAMKEVENEFPKILLAHSPDVIEKAKKEKIDLVLAGHTHGGQIKIPFFGPIWIPSKYGKKYSEGLFKENSTFLYVNRGVGTFLLPARFNCPPEITLIELTK